MNQNVSQIALVNRLKFKHLALLVALDDARNLHQAAEAINVAQPSASRMLSDIEEALRLPAVRAQRARHAAHAARRRDARLRAPRRWPTSRASPPISKASGAAVTAN